MAKPYIITSLDIGTSSIKGLSVLRKTDPVGLEILAQASEPVLGVRRGVVVDVDRVSEAIVRALSQLEKQTGEKINEVYVNINGGHIFTATSHGSVVVSRADQKISQEDINRVFQSAQAISLPLNKEIIEVFPKEYIVDGESGIKDALGMDGIRLEVEILALCVFSPYLKNLTNSVLNADVQIADIVPSPLASARAVLTPQQKELGVCLVDIGAGTTGLAIYKEGNLIRAAVLPLGSAHITQDIAIGLKTDIKIAEQIKREFGTCSKVQNNSSNNSRKQPLQEKKIKIELPGESYSLNFSRKLLTEIVDSRVSEILDLVQKEFRKISPCPLFPAGVVLTGGGSKLSGLVDFTKKQLNLPARVGIPRRDSEPGQGAEQQGWFGLEENPGLSTVCGLLLRGIDIEDGNPPGSVFSSKGILAKLKKFFRVFIP